MKTKNPVLPGKVSLSGSLSATPSKELKGQGALMTGPLILACGTFPTNRATSNPWQKLIPVHTSTAASNSAALFLQKVVRDGKCDGLIMHQNRSCKNMSLLNNEGGQRVQKNLGVPYVIFDGDQTDARNFSEAQFDTRVEALAEMMADKKAMKEETTNESDRRTYQQITGSIQPSPEDGFEL